jgi:hypothetical protein
MFKKPYCWCLKCRSIFSEEEIENAIACPSCGDKSLPAAIEDDVTIKINWQELRVLIMWSEFWANHNSDHHPQMPELVYKIADRIEEQYPDKISLSFLKEMKELKKELGNDITIKQNLIIDPEGEI